MRNTRKTLPGAFLLLCCIWADTHSAIFLLDERIPYSEAENAERLGLLYATGGIFCMDGTAGTGFVVDISHYVEGDTNLTIIATSARVLYDDRTGKSRGRCAFRPTSAPGQYLKLGEKLAGGEHIRQIDSNDWAFARLEKAVRSLDFRRMKLASTFGLDVSGSPRVWAAGFVPEWDSVAFATDCNADTGHSYSSLWRHKEALASMIIHDCDTMKAARGGPLAVRVNGSFRVVAINAGTSREDNNKELYGIPYDPQNNFFNYSRRFDKELEEKLVAFVSRFAHVKTASAGIREGNELVKEIQDNLNQLGFDSGTIDGLLGQKTEEAIKAFQTTLGIKPTGLVSEELLLLLKARASDKKTVN